MEDIKYPIGIQSFYEIRKGGYLYVDKTRFIYDLASTGKYYFLSRPRRFGKSLLMSTAEALFSSDRDLFKGLAIESLPWDWKHHEVFHLDFNGERFDNENSVNIFLQAQLKKWEKHYGVEEEEPTLGLRFREVIRKAAEVSGENVVILIDEYDKPILDTLLDKELNRKNRDELQAFYSVLKSTDQYIRFAMLTGVSKFGKVSIFSGLNNLQDISLKPEFNDICGITETELAEYFEESIKEIAISNNMDIESAHKKLKEYYDGYHFAKKGEDVYNPFSLLNVFKYKDFESYWFKTGTPSFLIRLLNNSDFEIPELEGYECSSDKLTGSDIYLKNPVPIFFQTGYLTIKGYDPEFDDYILGFPNREVAEGFSGSLLDSYSGNSNSDNFIKNFVRNVRKGK